MGNIELTTVMLILLSILITWVFTKYDYRKSSKDLPRLVKELAPYEGSTPENSAAKLLLELVSALEKNKIYWREFIVAAQAMIQAGNIANETIEHISLVESQRTALSTRLSPRETQSVRKMEIFKLRRTLEEQLKQ